MENIEIARVLGDVAALLEISGANPFRIRAYQNAARTVEDHTTALRKMVAEEADLTELPSVGKDIAKHITELIDTGHLSVLDELAAEVPISLIDLTKLPGVGAKKAKALWQELDVRTVDDLEHVATAGRIAPLRGFGTKSQQKILDAIAAFRRRQGRVRLADAERYVEPLVEYLTQAKGLERIEIAGSYRRRCETVGDIDLLAIAEEPDDVMERFTTYPDVGSVERAGGTRGTIVLKSGLSVDLRVLPAESYGAALQYFTGSKEHNVRFRTRAVTRGLRVSEYGVFRVKNGDAAVSDPRSGEFLGGRTEEEVYAALDLPWIPPELREDRGELDAAERGELPDLITLEDLRGDLQMHSTWSDGKDSIEAMLEGCVQRGYEYLAITDHSKALAMTGGLDATRLREQLKEIEAIQDRHPEIRIVRSMEVDILADGSLDLEDEMLDQLDLVVVSVHSRFDLPPAAQTERIITAVSRHGVHVLAHPTGRLINRRDPMDFDVDAVLQAAAEHGVAVELNAHPERLDLKDTHLMRAKELGVKITISTDAHRVDDLDLMRFGVEQARRAWLEPSDVLNCLAATEFLGVLGT